MSHPPRKAVCQGNFAASVKEILPIYQCGILAIVASIEGNSPRITDDLRHQLLDKSCVVGIIRFTQSRVPGGPHAPTPGLQG
jgi:hypothetical protein